MNHQVPNDIIGAIILVFVNNNNKYILFLNTLHCSNVNMQIEAYDESGTPIKNVFGGELINQLTSEKWKEDVDEFHGMVSIIQYHLNANKQNSLCCCVFQNDELVGISLCVYPQTAKGLCVINAIVVRKDKREKLLGSFIFSKIKMHAVIDKQTRLFLLTPLQTAQSFWEKHGFKKIENQTMKELLPQTKIPKEYDMPNSILQTMMFFKL